MAKGIKNKTTFFNRLKNIIFTGANLRFFIYRFKWNYFPRFKILNKFPLHVDIEVTDACNLKCIMCVHGTRGIMHTGFISDSLVYKAIDECSALGVYSIKFNYRGEPLLHKSLVDFVKYAKKKNIMEVQINTNGLLADKSIIIDLIDAGLDRIIYSVDGATKETYEKIRVGGDYFKLLDNIKLCLNYKKEKKLNKPFVRVQMVKYFGAENEVEAFCKYWAKQGVDNIAVIDKQDRDNDNTQPLKNGKIPIGRNFCEQPWQRININRDGKVLMCCGDWNRKSIVGDFNYQSLLSIWHSDKLNKLRNLIMQKKLNSIPACEYCFRAVTYKWEK